MRFRRTVAVLASIAFLTGCSKATRQNTPTQHSITYIRQSDMPQVLLPDVAARPGASGIDFHGKPIEVRDVRRIVSVATSCAEIIAALGFRNNLVGRDVASKSPTLKEVPVVTDALSINAERVLAQKPTLIIVDKQSGPTPALNQIANAGVQIVQVPTAWNLSDLAPRIRALATLLGVPAQAQKLKSTWQVRNYSRLDTRVAFLYLRGTSAIYLIGGKGSGADALVSAAGAVDVGAEAQLRAFIPMTPEALIKLAPDVLLVMTNGLKSVGGVAGLVKLPGVSQTPAGQQTRIIAVDDGLLLAFGADTYALIDRLHQALTQNQT